MAIGWANAGPFWASTTHRSNVNHRRIRLEESGPVETATYLLHVKLQIKV
jgi:hypothetical protein